MFGRRLSLFATIAFALTAGFAQAQTLTTSAATSASGQDLIGKAFAAATTAAEPVQAGTAGAPGDRYYNPRVFIGAWTSAGSGLLLGGGLAAHPFTERRHELQGNLAYLRVEESNGLDIDLNYVYNFIETQATGSWTPYAGAGINIVHFGGSDECSDFEDAFDVDLDCSATDTGLQIGGGLKRLWNGWQVFGELWFAFNSGNPIIVRGGVGW
jgi:hypothetical protein